MAKQKACKICNTIYEGEACPKCGSKESTNNFKGKVVVLSAEKSEIAKKLDIKLNGVYAIRT